MSRYENYEIKNNVFGTLSAPISSLATTIQLWDWQWQRFSTNMLATLENIENWKVMKREIVLITAISWDTLTVVRKYEPCPASDEANTQWQVSFSFSTDDILSVYITKKHFDNIKYSLDDLYNNWDDRLFIKSLWWLQFKVTAWNVRVWDVDIQFTETTWILTDNAINYIMISDSWTLNISTLWRDDEQARIWTVTTSWWNITDINMWKTDSVWWKIKTWWWVENFICWETIVRWDLVSVRDYMWANNPENLNLWDASTKVSTSIYWSGKLGDTISCYLWIVGNWQDVTVTVETDNNWEPSWTLVDVNATATIQASDLTTTLTFLDIQFSWDFTLSYGWKYRIVFSCASVDISNYVIIWQEKTKLTNSMNYNWWSWSNLLTKETITSSMQTNWSCGGCWAANQWFKIVFDIDLIIYSSTFSNNTTLQIEANGETLYSWSKDNVNFVCSKWVEYTFRYNNWSWRTGSTPPYNRTIPYWTITSYMTRWVWTNVSFDIWTTWWCISFASDLFSLLIKKVEIDNLKTITDRLGIAIANWTEWQDCTIALNWVVDNENRNFIPWQEYYITSNWFTYNPWQVNRIKLWIAKSNISISLNIWFTFVSYVTFYTQFSWMTSTWPFNRWEQLTWWWWTFWKNMW